jgi:D-aminopeptidase
MILAMGAGRLKVPLVAVSGDDQLEKEIHRQLPWVQYATVKHAVTRAKAESLARGEASRRIETAAREGLSRIAAARLPDVGGPFRFALTFQDETEARIAALLPGAEQTGTTVQIRANDFEEGYRKSNQLIGLAGAIARPAARQAVLNSQPDAEPLRVAVMDWLYGRFLETLPPQPPPASATSSGSPRYWGAQ